MASGCVSDGQIGRRSPLAPPPPPPPPWPLPGRHLAFSALIAAPRVVCLAYLLLKLSCFYHEYLFSSVLSFLIFFCFIITSKFLLFYHHFLFSSVLSSFLIFFCFIIFVFGFFVWLCFFFWLSLPSLSSFLSHLFFIPHQSLSLICLFYSSALLLLYIVYIGYLLFILVSSLVLYFYLFLSTSF